MQTWQPPLPAGNPAVRTGLLFGAILSAVGLADALIQWSLGGYSGSAGSSNGVTSVDFVQSGVSALLGCAGFLVILALTFVAGIRAAGQTGRVGSGSISGLIAGMLGALVGGVTGIIIILTTVAPNLQVPVDSSLTQGELQMLLITGAVFGVFFGALIDGGLGAGLGALGGLIGANNYRKAFPVLPYGFVPYYPGYPGYPAYPAAPGYPIYPGAPGYPGMPAQWGSVPQPMPNQYPTPSEQPPDAGTSPLGPE